MKVVNVVGARPNFVKIAPIVEQMNKFPEIISILVHTGQHYDYNMSKQFFTELNIPEPDIYLGVGSGTHALQTAKIMIEFEKVLLAQKPDLTLVVGDVNSTIACALTSVKLHIPVAHVEAGLRSFDRDMPEEINRLLTDAIADYLFVTEDSGMYNLIREGISKDKIFFVGNVMIDTLLKYKDKAKSTSILDMLKIKKDEYCLVTLHRPSNVDTCENLQNILDALNEIQKDITVIFPVHPRTDARIDEFGLRNIVDNMQSLKMIAPVSYLEFTCLMSNARFVLTDSGGIQEETTVLGVPCLTLRKNTERPVTVDIGTNIVVGLDKIRIIKEAKKLINGVEKKGSIPKYWDGKTAERIVSILMERLGK
jgi:UDP-N-acetylglucosamine 2-epimerase (non-hydrolysing)